jgi:alpha-galactosidase
MHDALKRAGRPIVFSLCEWGQNKPWLWAKDVGHLWRTTGDIADCWNCTNQWSYGWLRILDWQVGLERFSGPGHWNDPDMLEVGNGGMTSTEYKSHFSLWCILAAPLIAGNDVRQMTPDIKNILTNRELIAVNQDPLGKQGTRVRKDGDSEVWSKQLKDGSRAVVLFNRGQTPADISVTWEEIGYSSGAEAEIRDLWAGKNLGKRRSRFSSRVAPHDVVVINVMP